MHLGAGATVPLMYPRQPVPQALRGLAERQAGVVSRDQALRAGFSRSALSRLVADGTWRRTATGIFLTVPGPPCWSAHAWAGVLIGGDDARIGGLAAAHLHGLVATEPMPIEVLVPDKSRPRVQGPWYFHRERTGVRRYWAVGSPPRLSVEDTVLDLVNDPDCDARAAINWITLAVGARKTTPERILRAADHRRLLRQRALLRDILDDVRAGVRSPLEHDYLHRVERPCSSPGAAPSSGPRATIRTSAALRCSRQAHPRPRTGLGPAPRSSPSGMQRDNAATTDGLATLRYGKVDVFGIPCEVAEEVGINLMRRGWTGPRTRCPDCHRAG